MRIRSKETGWLAHSRWLISFMLPVVLCHPAPGSSDLSASSTTQSSSSSSSSSSTYVVLPTKVPVLDPLPQNASQMELQFQPALDFDYDACYVSAAIDPEGKTNPGIWFKEEPPDDVFGIRVVTEQAGQCRSPPRLNHSNVYSRPRCNNGWCAIMYEHYFEKDMTGWPWDTIFGRGVAASAEQGLNPAQDHQLSNESLYSSDTDNPEEESKEKQSQHQRRAVHKRSTHIAGHRHDWEHIIIWTRNGTLRHATVSSHGEALYQPGPYRITDDFIHVSDSEPSIVKMRTQHIKVVYHKSAWSTHAFRFGRPADDDRIGRNPTGPLARFWWRSSLVGWHGWPSEDLRHAVFNAWPEGVAPKLWDRGGLFEGALKASLDAVKDGSEEKDWPDFDLRKDEDRNGG